MAHKLIEQCYRFKGLVNEKSAERVAVKLVRQGYFVNFYSEIRRGIPTGIKVGIEELVVRDLTNVALDALDRTFRRFAGRHHIKYAKSKIFGKN